MSASARVERRFADFCAEMERRFAEADVKAERRFAALRAVLADQRADLIRWMFGFWIGTVVPLAGLIVALRVL